VFSSNHVDVVGSTYSEPMDLDPELLNTVPDDAGDRYAVLRAENAVAARYWGGFQPRMLATFLLISVLWTAVLIAGLTGALPLWLGLILNTLLASTFYMPMHETVHKNMWGQETRMRWLEDVVGKVCSIPLGMSFVAHRASHMRHHAYTNDPDRDSDAFSEGPLWAIPGKWFVVVLLNTFFPIFAIVPAARKLLPAKMKRAAAGAANKKEGLALLRFWFVTHAILLAAFLSGVGVPALLLWYIPMRLQQLWLLVVFAWYPHHPAKKVGRYVDTRVAVFPGSTFLIRGHDHHALHHLYPRVPHYRLKKMWQEVANDLVPKGVRAEGKALAATGPIVW